MDDGIDVLFLFPLFESVLAVNLEVVISYGNWGRFFFSLNWLVLILR
jgi:hypothetical protein